MEEDERMDVKGDLHGYLRGARETLVWKLEGLGEYDMRRPMTPTGTNLLGLVKHSAGTHLRYFGEVFGRSPDMYLPWASSGADTHADMWATPDETAEGILAQFRKTWEVADATIIELPLDAIGRVPWWGGDGTLTLHQVLVHVTAETQRHAGHADILRELIDGSAGLLDGHNNLRTDDPAAWRELRDRIEDAARLAEGR
jgi:hypothetical protein